MSTMQVILGGPLSISPDNSDSESDSGSDSTLEDLDFYPTWAHGYPLQRIDRVDPASIPGPLDRSASYASDSDSSTSSVEFDIDFEQLIDDLLAEDPFPLSETRNTIAVEASTPEANDSMTIKYLDASSPELLILIRLNHRDLRQDPWNPAPHIIAVVERDEHVFLCLQRLIEFNQPPLKTVSNYIDFFKQVLEGLTFLHEHSFAQLSCLDLSGYMVDLGSATFGSSAAIESFDRSKYPVRYYFSNLPNASEFENRTHPTFKKDVEECGIMMDRLGSNVPSISRKLNALVNAMRSGTFDADASRKLFEALCRTLPAEIFETPVPLDIPLQYLSGPNTLSSATITLSPPLPSLTSEPNLFGSRRLESGSSTPGATINIPRKPKSNTLSPRRSLSASPSRTRTRARSSEGFLRAGEADEP